MNENIFSGIANIYDKYRPSYPPELFAYLCSTLGINYYTTIADIGSGTGILSKQLLNICGQVYAIEPNDDMRKIAESNLSLKKHFISVQGTAENTTLPNHCVDCITAAQSFHWFDRELFKIECQRLLKDNGYVILIWNCREENNEIVQAIDSISANFCPDFSGASCGMRGEKKRGDYKDFFLGEYEIKTFYNPILFNKEKFLGFHQSASYCPHRDQRNYTAYMKCLADFFDEYSENGFLRLENNTNCYIGHV